MTLNKEKLTCLDEELKHRLQFYFCSLDTKFFFKEFCLRSLSIYTTNELKDNIAEMLEKVTSDVKVELYNRYSVKKSKEISLTKLDLTLAPEHFGLENREHCSTLGYLIPTVNVTKAKPCENVMKLANKKKRENTVHEF